MTTQVSPSAVPPSTPPASTPSACARCGKAGGIGSGVEYSHRHPDTLLCIPCRTADAQPSGACPRCHGEGTVADADPYRDRDSRIPCACQGERAPARRRPALSYREEAIMFVGNTTTDIYGGAA